MAFSQAAIALQPVTKAKTPPKPEEIKKAVDQLIKEGEGALAAEDFKSAKDAFMDALQLDKKSMLAAHGLGLTYIGLHEHLRRVRASRAGGRQNGRTRRRKPSRPRPRSERCNWLF